MDYEQIRLKKVRRFNSQVRRNKQKYKVICLAIPTIWIAAGFMSDKGGGICILFGLVFFVTLAKAWKYL